MDSVNKKGASVLDVVMDRADRAADQRSSQSSKATRFVKILVEKGAQVNISEERRIKERLKRLYVKDKIILRPSPLMQAVGAGNEDLVASLIEAGADVNYVGQNNRDALSLAIVNFGKLFLSWCADYP